MQKAIPYSHSHPLFFTLFATLFLIAFGFTKSYMAAPYIAGDLGGSNTIAVYTVALFGLGSALSIPLGKPMIANLHVRGTLVLCTLSMALFSGLCATAPNFPIYLIYRFLLGFSAGPLYSTVTFAISSLVPPEKKLAARSILVMILTVAPAISAAWGGWIAYEFCWQRIDTNSIPLLLIVAGMQAFCFRGIELTLEKTRFDWIGYIFFLIGISCLFISAITAQQLDWQRSPLLVALTLTGVPCLGFHFLWSWFHPNPILDWKMLKHPAFAFALFNLAVLTAAYFGMLSLLSLWLKLYANYTPDWIGVAIGTMALAGLFPRFLIEGRLSKLDPRIFLGLSIIFLAISCFHTTEFDVEINFGRIAFTRFVAGIGLALFLPPIFQMSMNSHTANKSVDVIELFQFIRNLAGGLGAACYAILWQRRQVFFHERLGEELNVFSMQTKEFFARVKQFKVPGDPNAQLEFFLQRRATSLALDDSFWLIAWVLVGLFVILLLTLRWTRVE